MRMRPKYRDQNSISDFIYLFLCKMRLDEHTWTCSWDLESWAHGYMGFIQNCFWSYFCVLFLLIVFILFCPYLHMVLCVPKGNDQFRPLLIFI